MSRQNPFRQEFEHRSAVHTATVHSIDDQEAQSAGIRIFEKLTIAQREELNAFLREKLLEADGAAKPGETSQWHRDVKNRTSDVIDQRTKDGRPADANFVVDDVLPYALSSVGEDVRRELFLKVKRMLLENPHVTE